MNSKTVENLVRYIEKTEDGDQWPYRGEMLVDGKLVARDVGYTYYEVAEKQRQYAEYLSSICEEPLYEDNYPGYEDYS